MAIYTTFGVGEPYHEFVHLLLAELVCGECLGLSCSHILHCACIRFFLLICGHDGFKSLGACVEFACFSEAGSPFRIPCRLSCSLLFRRQAVDRLVPVSRGSSPFLPPQPSPEVFHSVSFLSSHRFADRFLQQDQGLGPILPSHEGRRRRGARLSISRSIVCFSLIIFNVLALYCMVARVDFVFLSSYTVAALVPLEVFTVLPVGLLQLCRFSSPSSAPQKGDGHGIQRDWLASHSPHDTSTGCHRYFLVVPRPDLEMEAGKVHLPNCGIWWPGSAVDCWQSFGLALLNTAAHHRIADTERSSSSPRRGKS